MTVIGVTMVVRVIEGRPLVEPAFPLLVAAGAGGLAGFIAGYYNVRTRREVTRARQANQALSFVNALLRHDLRNDLNVIRAQAELLTDGDVAADGTDAPPRIDAVVRKTEEASSRIETSRAVTQALTGETDFDGVDLVGIVAGAAEEVEETFDMPVRTELPERAPVEANAGVRSVVDNLLQNAAEHNDADDPWVAVEVDRRPETVRLIVRDNGPGIPEPARRSALAAGDADTGGLSLVGTLIDAYGGDVRIENGDPRGATVSVTLPPAEDPRAVSDGRRSPAR